MKKLILLFALLALPVLHAHAGYNDGYFTYGDPQYHYPPSTQPQIIQTANINYYGGPGYGNQTGYAYQTPYMAQNPNYYPGNYYNGGYGYVQATQVVSTENVSYGYYGTAYPPVQYYQNNYYQPQPVQNYNNGSCGYNNCPCPHPYW